MGALAELDELLGADLSACTAGELGDLASLAHRGRREIHGFLARVASAAALLEGAGSGAPASAVLNRGREISQREATKLAARAGLGEVLASVGDAVSSGRARPENADAIGRALASMSDTERDRFAQHDAELAARAASMAPEPFAALVRKRARAVKDPDAPSEAEAQKAAAELAFGRRPSTGMWWFHAELDDERGALCADRVRARARQLAGDAPVTANLLAAALFDLVAGSGPGDSGLARMGVGYIVDAATLVDGPHGSSCAQTYGGDDVDPAALGRLACDADLYAVMVDRLGTPGAAARTHRRASRQQRLQLRALYPRCPLDGTRFDRCEIHHVNVAFDEGGHTELDNLLPLSVAWHHRIHDRGWNLKMLPDRTLILHRPDGTLDREIPPPTPITRNGP